MAALHPRSFLPIAAAGNGGGTTLGPDVVRPPLRAAAAAVSLGPMSLEITWLGHATVLIELDGTRLITDPVVRNRVGPLVRIAPPVAREDLRRIDAVLLSHLHADHADPASLRRIERAGPLVAPGGAARWLRRRGFADAVEVRAGDQVRVGSLDVVAVPAEHERGRHPLGPSAEPVGFVVRGSRSVYFAGDTDLFEGMADLQGAIDLALMPVAGWGPTLPPGHLNPVRAVRALQLIGARVAIPIHWGTFALPRLFRGKLPGKAPALEFTSIAARDAPDVDVRVLSPGERTTV
jgi:L-ascorbate metabolism protein UlaG (beta-lactamase superfamily)